MRTGCFATDYTAHKCGLIAKRLMVKPRTINEAIEEIYSSDIRAGYKRDGWKFYVHLNKLPAQMEREGYIKQTGEKTGPTGRLEKVWSITQQGRVAFK